MSPVLSGLHGCGLEASDQLSNIRRRKNRRLTARRLEDGGDFPQPERGPLKGVGCRELRGLAGSQFVELGSDVTKIALQVFLHRAGLAIPLGTLVAGGRETIV